MDFPRVNGKHLIEASPGAEFRLAASVAAPEADGILRLKTFDGMDLACTVPPTEQNQGFCVEEVVDCVVTVGQDPTTGAARALTNLGPSVDKKLFLDAVDLLHSRLHPEMESMVTIRK